MAVLAGCAVLGSDRLVPGRRLLIYIGEDGVETVSATDPPLILSDHPDSLELERVRFATSLLGYNRDEVDGVLAKVVAENKRLRHQLAEQNGEDGVACADD